VTLAKDIARVTAAGCAQLESDEQALLNFLEEDHVTVDIREFITRVFAWYHDKTRSQYLYEMFRDVLNLDDKHFVSSVHDFVVNELLDDGSFEIHWCVPVYKNGFSLVYTKNGDIKYKRVKKTNPRARPRVVRGGDNSTQNVALLLDAMEIHEEREEAWRTSLRADGFL
jgi:hypothetical protein